MKYINKKGQILTVEQDNTSENPMMDWDFLGTYYTFETYSISPMEHDYSSGMEGLMDLLGEKAVTRIHSICNNSKEFFDKLIPYAYKKGYILRPLGAQEHGSKYYNIGAMSGWDCGTVGFVFVEKSKALEFLGKKRISAKTMQQIEKILEFELNTYNQWINGEVYGYTLENSNGEILDSCYGFYGMFLDTDLEEAQKIGMFDNIGGSSADWKPAKVDHVIYTQK